jgi:hypothetical protein
MVSIPYSYIPRKEKAQNKLFNPVYNDRRKFRKVIKLQALLDEAHSLAITFISNIDCQFIRRSRAIYFAPTPIIVVSMS